MRREEKLFPQTLSVLWHDSQTIRDRWSSFSSGRSCPAGWAGYHGGCLHPPLRMLSSRPRLPSAPRISPMLSCGWWSPDSQAPGQHMCFSSRSSRLMWPLPASNVPCARCKLRPRSANQDAALPCSKPLACLTSRKKVTREFFFYINIFY